MQRFWALSIAVVMSITGSSSPARDTASEVFELRAMPGFRLTRPYYHASGDGMDVSVTVCRIVGWAASSASAVHFLRAGNGDEALRHHDVRIGRMGLRSGENCERIGTHFDGAPQPPEKIAICLAYSDRRCG
jgi:hypothetical protein